MAENIKILYIILLIYLPGQDDPWSRTAQPYGDHHHGMTLHEQVHLWQGSHQWLSSLINPNHLAVDMLQLPEVYSVLAGAGEAGSMVAKLASLCEAASGYKHVILLPDVLLDKQF